MSFSTILFMFGFQLVVSEVSLLEIENSGFDEIPPFGTVLTFSGLVLEVRDTGNNSIISHIVSFLPEQCCLFIEPNDVDCQILNLGTGKNAIVTGTENTMVTFTFRNLYVRYRIGLCHFVLTDAKGVKLNSHIIPFNTFPEDHKNCTGVDQDPDRNCIPVDCAIKYKGYRNYYNATIGKCQPVAKCNTRGEDGITITAYYDWKTNECIEYEWFSNDNYFDQVESDTEIPVSIDPSQTKYYPDLEPQLIKSSTVLDCNHGEQSDNHCVCDEGWISSGIHHDSPLVFHWCDERIMAAALSASYPPRKLNKSLEYFSITVSFH